MFELRKLSAGDGMEIYEMLQEIPAEENNMHNSVCGISYESYQDFLAESEKESAAEGLIDGWRVPSTRYWLYVEGKPVGFADLRHFLTPALRQSGGNIGYAIRPTERGKGYGKKLLELLLEEARKMKLEKVLITARPINMASIGVAKANGGKIVRQTEECVYLVIPLVNYSDVKLETEDLILRKARLEDWRALYHNLWKHEESAKYMLWRPKKSEEEARECMNRTVDFQKTEKYAFLVYLRKTGEPIGFAGMKDAGDGVYGETGIALGPEFVGKGYGRQIFNVLTEEAKRMGATKFVAGNRTENEASCRSQRACGFFFDHLSEEKTDPKTGEKYFLEYNVKTL